MARALGRTDEEAKVGGDPSANAAPGEDLLGEFALALDSASSVADARNSRGPPACNGAGAPDRSYAERGIIDYPNGDVYEGGLKDGKRHGRGVCKFACGSIYDCEWQDDAPHGEGRFTASNGHIYVGEIKDGKKHGKGRAEWSGVGVYDGEWLEGVEHGTGTYHREDGITYEGEFENGREHGKGALKGRDWSCTGDWKNGKMHGRGVWRCDSGSVYDGEWKEGERHGVGTMTYEDGRAYQGEFKEGTQHGKGTMKWADSGVYDGEWKNGQMNGKGVYTFSNGDVYDGEWKNGQMNGTGTETFANGGVYEGECRDGKAHGRGTMKWEGGKVYVGEFKNDKQHGQGTMMWPSGKAYEGHWVDGVEHGKGTMKHPSGEIIEGNWVRGELANGDAINQCPPGNVTGESSLPNADTRNDDTAPSANRKLLDGRRLRSQYSQQRRLQGGKRTCENAKMETIHYDNGDVYEGEVKDGRRNGKGVCRYADGCVYDGEWKDDLHQWGTMSGINGAYKGEWKDNKMHGTGIFVSSSGDVYEGEFEQGTFWGKGTNKWKDGQSYSGDHKEGKAHGRGTLVWKNGHVYEGEWVEGKQHGRGTITKASGEVFDGEFVDGQRVWSKARVTSLNASEGKQIEREKCASEQPAKGQRLYDECTLRSTQSQQRRLENNVTAKKCEHCGVDDYQYKLRVCSRCNLALFCSAACQQAASRSHRRICDIASELPSRDADQIYLRYDRDTMVDLDAGLRCATKYMANLKYLQINLETMAKDDTIKLSAKQLSSLFRSKRGSLKSVFLLTNVLGCHHLNDLCESGAVWKDLHGLKQLRLDCIRFNDVQPIHDIIGQQKGTLEVLWLPRLQIDWSRAKCRRSLAQAISSCKRLVKLDLRLCLLMDSDLKIMLQDLPNLRILHFERNLKHSHEFTDNTCAIIARKCPGLQELSLFNHIQISVRGIRKILGGCIHLRSFATSSFKLRSKDVQSLLDGAPRLLFFLYLGGESGVPEAEISEIIEATGGRVVFQHDTSYRAGAPYFEPDNVSVETREKYERLTNVLRSNIWNRRDDPEVANEWAEMFEG
ncbi:hypothetical protein ACHAXT_000090 [Thalassiosira profunda]